MAALGGTPLLVGVVGEDRSGEALLGALAARGIGTEGVVVHPGWTTPTKTRILAGFPTGSRQQVVRIDQEPAGEVPEAVRVELALRISRLRGLAGVAILSDYGYGAAHPALLPELRAALKGTSSGHVVVDSRFRLLEFKGAWAATPNLEEAEAALGGAVATDSAALSRGGRELRTRLGLNFLLITRGSRGMSLFLEDAEVHLPVFGSDQVADVTGAGDTVIGTLTLALAAGASPFEAAVLANLAGGVVVMKLGTATLERAELERAVTAVTGWIEGCTWVRY